MYSFDMAVSPRHPIVAVMGHIDHGKSSLLDYIRKANVVAGEAGGITQHVSAYVAEREHEGVARKITFLDTPGHEAFRALRARGAAAADIAILVIASDEGVKPQTKEAFGEITAAGIPFVVAFTKIDKNGADVERAKVSALEAGIYLEGLGGSVPFAPVSSKSGEGVDTLLDLVLLTADLAELTADPAAPPSGFVLESSQDPKQGVSATLIVKNGTLAVGMVALAGSAIAPVRFIEDFLGNRLKEATPSLPIAVSGWSELPSAGDTFTAYETKKEAEKAALTLTKSVRATVPTSTDGKATLPLLIKADVSGSVEAITALLSKLSHERIQPRIIGTGIGSVSESDVKTAAAGGGVVIGFHVGVETLARDLAERTGVPIETFDIIYELEKRVGELLIERAPRMKSEETLGEAKVLKSFSMTGAKQVLGARHMSGQLTVGDQVKVTRRDIELGRGRLLNLQVAKSDVKEIHVEGEFGLQVESKTEIAGGDVLTAFRVVES
jgi:translation initiation factor IF-2